MTSKGSTERLSVPAVSAPEELAPPTQRRLQLWISEELYCRIATYKVHHRSTSLTSIAIEALEEWAAKRGL